MMHHAHIAGLSISSDLELPGIRAAADPDARPDVIVRRGAVPVALPEGKTIGPTLQMAAGHLLLSIPKVARLLVSTGNTITVDIEEGVPETDVGIFLVGSVFGMLLHQRGCIVLHASAVEVNGRAVLFCGPSGAGKSTIAAALNEQGHHFVTDDVCAIALDRDNRPIVRSDGRRLKLWDDAIKELSLDNRQQQPVRSTLKKYYVPPREAKDDDAIPLAGIYILKQTSSTDPAGIEKLSSLDALTQIRLNAYRPRLLAAMGTDQTYLTQCAAIVKHAAVFDFTRQWGFENLQEIVDMLRIHWSPERR